MEQLKSRSITPRPMAIVKEQLKPKIANKGKKSASSLKMRQLKSGELSAAEIEMMYNIYQPHHNVSFVEFQERSIKNFNQITIHESRSTKEIVGFVGVKFSNFTTSDKTRIRLIYYGQMFIKPEYRGCNLVQKSAIPLVISSALFHPLKKTYFWGDVISLKSYLLLVRSYNSIYPAKFENPPVYLKEVQDYIGQKYYPQYYNQETGCVYKPSNKLKDHVCKITEKDLRNPDVQNYVRLNPGWQRGDGLIMIGHSYIGNIVQNWIRYLKKRSKHRKTNR